MGIMRHPIPPSPLNLVRRPPGTRPIPSLVTPGTSSGPVSPFVVDDYYVQRSGPREGARKVPGPTEPYPDSDDSSYEEAEDLVPCPQWERVRDIRSSQARTGVSGRVQWFQIKNN